MKTLDEKIKEIVTAYFIGLGYTVPPYNGSHSKEYFKQLKQLFLEEIKRAKPEKKYPFDGSGDEDNLNYGFNKGIDQYEKAMEDRLTPEKK